MSNQNFSMRKSILWIIKLLFLVDLMHQYASQPADECTEQWNEIPFDKENWELVGDVSYKEQLTFYRDPNQKSLVSDVGGAAWYKINKNNLSGVKISFTPVITTDLNYYGNVKYPQGFAFVFTANPVGNVIGEKRSGLGYDGIENAVAFEWDFIQNSDKNDIREPHFSAHYNLNGPISSASPPDCKTLCNVKLTNFYDSQKVYFNNQVEYTLEIFGGTISLYENGALVIKNVEFPFLDQLMEENQVFIGITASMNLYKAITLKNLRMFKIANSDKPILSIPNQKEYYDAGNPLLVNFFINSICGRHIKIFPQQFSKLFSLKVNNQPWDKSISISFDKKIYSLAIVIRDLTKAGKAVITPTWKGIDGSNHEITIAPGEVTKYDICDPSYDRSTNVLKTSGRFIEKSFTFTICTTDQYRNAKMSKHTNDDQLVKVQYPYLIPPTNDHMKIEANNDKSQYKITVPLTGIGIYTIYNEQFFNGVKKTFEVLMGKADPEHSYAEINNYFENRKASPNQQIILYIHLKDSYGNIIPSDKLALLKCTLESSVIEHTFQEQTKTYNFAFPGGNIPIVDNYPALTYTPQNPGEYVFKPRVKCGNDKNPTDLRCDLCTFYIATAVVDTTRLKVFSDFKNSYIYSDEAFPFYISLDEPKNKKITNLKFVDTSGMDMLITNIDIKNISVYLVDTAGNRVDLTPVLNPIGSVDVFLESGKDRTAVFTPFISFFMLITIKDPNFVTASTIPISFIVTFAFKDDYLNNVNMINQDDVPEKSIVNYMPGSFTIRASSNQLLFKMIARNSNNELTMGNSIDKSKISLNIVNSVGVKADWKATAVKSGIFHYVSASPTIAGSYTVDFMYDGKKIQSYPITVTPRYEVSSLTYDAKSPLIKTSSENVITLKEVEVGKTVAFLMNMLDDFGNVISDNYLSIFNSISIQSSGEISIDTLFDGTLSIISKDRIPGTAKVTLTLSNSVQYTIQINRFSTAIDPSQSSSEIVIGKEGKVVGSAIQVKLLLADKFGNDIGGTINAQEDLITSLKDNLMVFLLGPNNAVVNLSYDSIGEDNRVQFTTADGKSATVSGEYSLNIFYKNVPVSCSICYLNITPAELDLTKTAAFMIGFRSNYKLYTDARYQVLTHADEPVIFIVFKDKFENELDNVNAVYDILLTNEEDKTSLIKFCRVEQENKKRQYYQICSGDDQKTFAALKKGKYYIKVDQNQFKLFIDETYFEAKDSIVEPSSANSYIRNGHSLVNGSTDLPARIVIDFRSEKYLRYSELDVSKITITSDNENLKDLSVKFLYGPLKGLVTALVSTSFVGSAKLTIKYSDKVVISNIQFNNNPGNLASIEYVSTQSIFFSNGQYHFFQLSDKSKAKCGFFNLGNTLMNNYLIDIFSSNLNNYITGYTYKYNPLRGILSINLESQITGDLKLTSPFMTEPVTIPSTKSSFNIDKTFVHLKDSSDAAVSSKAVLKIQPLDFNRNPVSFADVKSEVSNFSLLVTVTENESTHYLGTVKASASEENGELLFEYTFTQPGDYLFIPAYNGMTIKCLMCRKKVLNDVVSLANTGLQIKTSSGWSDKTQDMIYKFFLHTYPVFKITLKDKYNSQLNSADLTGYSFELIVEDGKAYETVLGTNVFQSSRNGVYVYLNKDGREKYLDLKSLTNLRFRIKNANGKLEFTNFLVLKSEKKNTSSSSGLCANNAVPTFASLSDKIIRAGGDLISEFSLKGCYYQEATLYDSDGDFLLKSSVNSITGKVIPIESNGKYLLILTSKVTTNEPALISVSFMGYSSQSFNVAVVPGYSIGKISFSSAGTFTSIDTHGLFYMTVYDSNMNIITGENTMIFSNDIFIDLTDSNNRKIQYKVAYSTDQNAFIVQFPILYWDNYTVRSNYADAAFVVYVKPGVDLYQSAAAVSKTEGADRSFDVKVTLRDIKLKRFSSQDIQLTNEFKFKYYTYNSITGEEYIADILNVKLKDSSDLSTLLVTIPEPFPIYQYSSILPYSGIYPIACSTCMSLNKDVKFGYAFQTDDNRNIYFSLPTEKSYYVNTETEKLLVLYETSSEEAASLTSFEVASLSYPSSLSGKLTFVGMDTLRRSNQAISGSNDFKFGNGIVTKVFFDVNKTVSNAEADATNSRVYSRKIIKFKAGEKAYFFVEVRDRENKVTDKMPVITLTADDLKFNLIKSSNKGLYLIEVITDQISKYKNFNVKINGKEISNNIGLLISPAFPVSLDVNTQKIVDWTTVQYNAVAFDQFNNGVCDERLSFIARMNNQLLEKYIFFDEEAKTCRVMFYFSGNAVLTSPLFKTGTKKILENIGQVRVSPFASSVILDQNNSRTNVPIVLTLKLISSSGYIYPFDTTKSGMILRVYSINGYTNKRLMKEIVGINTLVNSYTPESLGISYGDYIITAIVDGTELELFAPFRYYKSFVQDPTSIQINLKSGNEWKAIEKIYDSTSTNVEKIELPYPFSMLFNFINDDGQKISIPANAVTVVSLLEDSQARAKIFDFEGIRSSETSYLIEVPKDQINTYLHLPKGSYVIALKSTIGSKTIEKFIYVMESHGLFQKDNLSVPYALPGVALSNHLDIVGIGNESKIITNAGSYSRTNLCIKSGDKIYNDYLDPDKFQINNLDKNNCSWYNSISLRGCIELFLRCNSLPLYYGDSYRISVSYNDVSISSQLTIFIDPQLPPASLNVLAPFPSKVNQKTEILTQFNLLDKDKKIFKYVNSDNFEVYINNEQLSADKWMLFFNRNLQLKLLNMDYPPRKQQLQVLFKDTYGEYTKLSSLTTDLTISQGQFDGRRTVISFPASYYAGDPLSFIVLIKDSYSNCYEDDLNISKFRVKLNLGISAFTDFTITQESLDFVSCNKVLRITTTVDDSPLKNVGEYTLDVLNGDNLMSSVKINVLPNKLSPARSSFVVTGMGAVSVAQVKAGTAIEIQMAGTDAYGNPVSYYDISERIDLKIEGLKKDADFIFNSRIDEKKTKVLMNLAINTLGRYHLNYTIDNLPFDNLNGLKEVIVTSGVCSSKYPNINVPFSTLYTGDYGKIIIKCLDEFNNTISLKGDEKFNIEIKGRNLEIVGEDKLPYEFNFNTGEYSAKFLLAYQGIYDVAIFLNGHKYGTPFTIEVMPQKCPNENPIMCSNKKCVNRTIKCTTDTDIYNCPDETKPFYCKVSGEKQCVAKTTECDCSSGFSKCNGMCLPQNATNYCEKPITTNCQRKLGTDNFISCPDGSCRTANSKCPNPLGCPLGFKPCGIGCINRNETCTVQAPTCQSTQVQCWDMSCTDSIDSCPTGKTCKDETNVVCPDGKCVADQTQCSQPPVCNAPFSFLCSDFTCKKSASDCNKKPVCFSGQSLCQNNVCDTDCSKSPSCSLDKFLCPTGQCVANILLCPTPISCPNGFVKCPSGTCAKNFDQCNFVTTSNTLTCPLVAPILCHDLSCVIDASLCNPIPPCPTFAPFRCSNNECRLTKEDCPSTPVCPAEYPVLCSDGTCQKASYHCTNFANEKPCDKIRCAEGTCVNSISLCPNHVTCGPNQIKCWDGACVKDIKDCRDPKYINCPDNLSFRCPDGSCRKDKMSCSTVSICPTDKPVKCYDNSCREHILLCPSYQNCGKNMKSCPDGTCSSDKCNTVVTCPPSMPFLCYDNTCKTDIRDCPNAPVCNGGILCPDGSCVSNRQLCKFFDPCLPANPVRCQQGSCAQSVEDCYSTIRECPIGFFKCKTGGCRVNEALCDKFTCPSNLPYLCPEGTCAESKSYCDSEITGCPYILPVKCIDGTCVSSLIECNKFSSVACPTGAILCPDGSCRKDYDMCPFTNGCTKEKPMKCADGVCIDPTTTTCSPPTCSFETPIKCHSGECVATSANCPSSVKEQDYKDCEAIGLKGLFMCADGRCVSSPDYCKALYQCPVGYSRCADGSCKLSSSLCPASSNCPTNRPIRCTFGKCVTKDTECYSNILCPPDFAIRCEKTGECVKDSSSCPGKEITANGCPQETPFKCLDGRCMGLEEHCSSVNIACTVENPVLCPDGTCKENREACQGIRDTCADGYERCPDGTCVEKNTVWNSCKNKIGCPLVKPIRCTDGSCVDDSTKCKSTIACNTFNPVLCADKSCKADSKFCNVVYPCPLETSFRCSNGYCAKDEASCSNTKDLCPLSAPFKCPSGRCANNIMDCSPEYYVENCKDNEFFCAATSSCVSGAAACIGSSLAAGVRPGSARILQNSKGVIENGCSSSSPYACYDGTCRVKREECPLLPACNVLEYRCSNGSCQKDPAKCRENAVVCEQGLNKCEDGLCRKECPAYNGCGLAAPFQCTNGMCVKNNLECIGYSLCSPATPYRCADGACVSDPNVCVNVKRLNSAKKMTVSISKFNEVNIPVVFDRTRRNIAKIVIPGNSIEFKKSVNANYTNIYIDEVPHSTLYSLSVQYNNSDALTYNISNGIPASDGVLSFENSVMSPIVKISGENVEDKLRHLARIQIEHNFYIQNRFLASDYCLAKLINNNWICVDRKASDEQINFTFDSFGIYAVVLNPDRDLLVFDPSDSSNFFVSNIQTIAIVLGVLFLISIIIFYIFTRVIRYREKYKDNKEKMINLQNQIEEYKNMSTDVPGQTLGDNIAGIVFTRNPAHSVTSVAKGSAHDLENEIEELQRKCRTMEQQNKTMEDKIQDTTEQYKMLKMEIDRMKR